jgi:hypothetical protein
VKKTLGNYEIHFRENRNAEIRDKVAGPLTLDQWIMGLLIFLKES